MSLEEATGLIQGLADVVKNQQQLQNTAIQKTTEQLQTLSDTVATLAQNLPSASPSIIQPNGHRLPNLILPIYTGREHLDRFITQLESILKSSNVPSQYWLTYLKQQTQQDNRAYDAICEAETANSVTILGPDVSKTSPAKFTKLYQTCVNALKTKRGKPRDQQLRDLLGAYYTMQQQPNESVADFAHRFTETQHELEKLLPKIHRAADADGNDEVELIYSFSIKLKKSISKDLMSRDFKYKTLQELISAAQRYELHSETLSGKDYGDLSAWGLNNTDTPEPVAVYSGPMQARPSPSHFSHDFSYNQDSNPTRSGRPKPGQHNSRNRPNSNFQHQAPTAGTSKKSFSRSTGTSEICNMFNKFKKSICELPNNKCFYHRLHKCSACQKWGCKACNHKPPGQTDFNKPQAKTSGPQILQLILVPVHLVNMGLVFHQVIKSYPLKT